jgi:hypothetical protein
MNGTCCSQSDGSVVASARDRVEPHGQADGVGLLDDLAHGALRVAAGEVRAAAMAAAVAARDRSVELGVKGGVA